MATQAIALGVWGALDRRHQSTGVDDRLLEIYGFGSETMSPCVSGCSRCIPEDRRSVTDALRKAMRDGGDMQVDFRIRRPDRSTRYIYGAVTAIPAADDGPDQPIGVNWDITQQKAAEDQFRKC